MPVQGTNDGAARTRRGLPGQAMVRTMCAQVDAGDAAGFASWFDEAATYRFGNAEPVVGRIAIEAATASAATTLPWLRHTVNQVAAIDDQLFCRFTIETESPSGTPVAMPCVTVIWLADDVIVDYRVHMDMSPALAPGRALRSESAVSGTRRVGRCLSE